MRLLIIGVLLCGVAVLAATVWLPTGASAAATATPNPSTARQVPHHAPVPTSPAPTAPTPAVAASTAPSTVVIRLHHGDTLWALARRYATTVTMLQQANGLGGSTLIHADADFRIPSTTSTIVVPATVVSAVATTHLAAAPVAFHRTAPRGTTAYRSTGQVAPTAAVERPAAGSVQQAAAAIFGSQYLCAANIITRESGWNIHATNSASGAYGLAQALPGSKMAAAGPDWRTNPATQLAWMRDYVTARYGGACNAWNFWQAHHWY